jgi:hypothetical protein
MLAFHLLDVFPAKNKTSLLAVNNEQRPLNSTSISVEANLFVWDVTNNRDFFRDLIVPTKIHNTSHKIISITVSAPPISIHENLYISSINLRLSYF